MSLKTFYIALLLVFATVVGLSMVWEGWLEDWLLPSLVSHHEPETLQERWEFVVTAAVISFLSLVVPTFIGTRILRRDQVLRQTITRLSEEDYLTGLYNRRRSMELLESEVGRATRYKTVFSVILTDVDHFKAVNDQLGHQAGDKVLFRLAEIIRSSVRASDRVGRWGGEEFVIISPETDIDGGYALAEKIRVRFESADLGQIESRTSSFGVATYVDGDNVEDIMARADAALYAAKHAGRNRVEKGLAAADFGFGERSHSAVR